MDTIEEEIYLKAFIGAGLSVEGLKIRVVIMLIT